MVVTAETEVKYDYKQDAVCPTAAIVTSSIDSCEPDMPCYKLDNSASAAKSDQVNKDNCQSLAEWLDRQHLVVIIITTFSDK